MDKRPVGFCDSGLGGASVLREALRLLPGENYIYYGDNKNAPYGDKPEDEITRLAFNCADYLVGKGCKAMLLACNTATSAAIRSIREHLSIPVISVEPAIKPACCTDGNGKVLMLATSATTKMQRYRDLQSRMPDPERVINIPCPGLVERIERGILEADAFDDLFDGFLSSYHGMEIDGIVLGCTHFVFIKNAVSHYAKLHFDGPCKLYDGNAATVLQLGRVLKRENMENGLGCASVEFYTSGDPAVFRPTFDMLLSIR